VGDADQKSALRVQLERPEDAAIVARRARELKFATTMGIVHNGQGQLRPPGDAEHRLYREIVQETGQSFSTFAYYNQFQKNLIQGKPNDWHCRAGCRYLYICEDGLVHYCSQQRGAPGIPLEKYITQDLQRIRECEVVRPILHDFLCASGFDD
jgi:hypothetical protein